MRLELVVGSGEGYRAHLRRVFFIKIVPIDFRLLFLSQAIQVRILVPNRSLLAHETVSQF